MTELADPTEGGARVSDIDGMSQITFHTNSQFGAKIEDDDKKSSASVYTKPFTVQTNKNSN